jgi:hypothetical protein
MFEWLENSSVAIWVAESLWAYPFCLSLHAIGLAIVVGIFAMRDLKLLGLFAGIEATAFLPIVKFAWVGFTINAISGFLLFTSQATFFVTSIPFLLKISMIVIAVILAGVIQTRLRMLFANDAEVTVTDNSLKAIALLSLGLWTGAIVAGRLIAYL